LLMGAGMGIHAEGLHALRGGDRVIAAELGVHDHDLPAGSETALADAARETRSEEPIPKVVDGTVLNVRDSTDPASPSAGRDGGAADPRRPALSPPPRPDAGRPAPPP
ncbi:hypothetical protein, partial [Actinoallomurus acaciae]